MKRIYKYDLLEIACWVFAVAMLVAHIGQFRQPATGSAIDVKITMPQINDVALGLNVRPVKAEGHRDTVICDSLTHDCYDLAEITSAVRVAESKWEKAPEDAFTVGLDIQAPPVAAPAYGYATTGMLTLPAGTGTATNVLTLPVASSTALTWPVSVGNGGTGIATSATTGTWVVDSSGSQRGK